MAKSLRSKWKRKCRAVKRERYSKKELERLKNAISNDPCSKPADVDMEELSTVVKIVNKKAIQQKSQKEAVKRTRSTAQDEMQVDTNSKERVFNPKTLKDQHGTYPVWVHPRKIHKRKKIGKGKIKKKSKK